MLIKSSNKEAITAGNGHKEVLRLIHRAKQLGDQEGRSKLPDTFFLPFRVEMGGKSPSMSVIKNKSCLSYIAES